MKRVAVIGHFAYGKEYLDGQTVKTKTVTAGLKRALGESEVRTVDTHGGKKKLLFLPFSLLGALIGAKNILILPAHNGLRVIAPLLAIENKVFGRKLHYAVIGGWLPEFVAARPRLAKSLKRFDGIYVETETMRAALAAQGFENVSVVPNCKDLKCLAPEELVYPAGEPYRLCTFSRVMREKGIEDAVEAVKCVNAELGRTVYTLDIYGQVDPSQTEWFEVLSARFGEAVRYGGLVAFDRSVEVLKDYFALLFPTCFYTEGIPGTILDAYASGIPVISTEWESFSDIVDDGKSGIGISFGDPSALVDALLACAEHPERLVEMKKYCLEKSKDYLPENAILILTKQME